MFSGVMLGPALLPSRVNSVLSLILCWWVKLASSKSDPLVLVGCSLPNKANSQQDGKSSLTSNINAKKERKNRQLEWFLLLSFCQVWVKPLESFAKPCFSTLILNIRTVYFQSLCISLLGKWVMVALLQCCPKQQIVMFNSVNSYCPFSNSLCFIVGEVDYGGFVCSAVQNSRTILLILSILTAYFQNLHVSLLGKQVMVALYAMPPKTTKWYNYEYSY